MILKLISLVALSFVANDLLAVERIQCDNDGWQDYNCRIINPSITSAAEPYHTDFTVSYNFACRTGSFPTSVQVKSGTVVSEVFFADSARTVSLSGFGPLILKDNPDETAEEYFTSGCRLTIDKVEKRPSSLALQIWSDQAAAEISVANNAIDTIEALEATKLWYDLYISDSINASVIESVIERLESNGDVRSKLQARKLQEVITEGNNLDIDGDILTQREKLKASKLLLESLNSRFVTAGKGSQKFITDAIEKALNSLK